MNADESHTKVQVWVESTVLNGTIGIREALPNSVPPSLSSSGSAICLPSSSVNPRNSHERGEGRGEGEGEGRPRSLGPAKGWQTRKGGGGRERGKDGRGWRAE